MHDTYIQSEKELIEKGGDLEHQRWAGWQKYMFSKFVKNPTQMNGTNYYMLPEQQWEHWNRQINTQYSNLSEQEKESDRKEVEKYIPLIRTNLIKQFQAYVKELEGERKEILEVETGLYAPKDETISLSGAYGYNQALTLAIEKANNFIKYLEQK